MSLISLKEHMERAHDKPASTAPVVVNAVARGAQIKPPGNKPVLPGALAAYSEAVSAMGTTGELAIPPISRDFHQNLDALAKKLAPGASSETIESVRAEVASELNQWGKSASRYFKEKSDIVREIVMVVARTAEAVGERDIRYAGQFGDLTGRLREIAGLENFASVRKNLVESAAQLTACVSKMTEEGQQALEQMRAQMETYRGRLEDAERRASVDLLTGLSNRRATEEALAERIRQGRPFSIILVDLNDFKAVNDALGHTAGDDLLKQFSTELRAQFAPSDTVGRWGGDEFIGMIEGHIDKAVKYHDRLERWAFGDYSIMVGNQSHKISLCGAVGIAEWNGAESARDLIGRADRELYEAKGSEPAGSWLPSDTTLRTASIRHVK